MKQFGKLVVFFPKTTIALTLAVTVLLGAALAWNGISFDGSPQTLARNDGALHFYNQLRATFGDDRVIIVALTTDDVFTPDFIQKVRRLTSRFEDVRGVDEVLSLTNIKAIRRIEGGILVDKLLPTDPSPDQLTQIKQSVTRDPLYARHCVSEDARTAAIDIFIKPLGEAETRAVAEEVERVAKAESDGDEVLLSGVPIVDAHGIRSMGRDMLLISPIAALLCFIVFLAAFRSFWGAALPMAALMIGLLWTIGLMSLAGHPVTFATLSLPTTLLAVGSSYIFHVLNQYRISLGHLSSGRTPHAERKAWLEGLRFIGPAVLVSGATTMAGFGALASSTVPTVRDMGIFEALGIGFMLLLCLSFIPAVLSLLPSRALSAAPSGNSDYATWLNGLLRHVTALVMFRRRTVLIVFLVMTLIIGAGALWVRVDADYLRIFPPNSETVQSAEKLHARLAGAATIQVVVSGPPGTAAEPEFLLGVSRLEQFSLEQAGVDTAVSVADIVKRFEALLDPNRSQTFPDASRLRYIFDEFLSQDPSLARLVNSERSAAVIVLRTNLYSSNELRELTNKIAGWSSANMPAGISVRPTGSVVLLNDASDAVAASQSSSMAIALVSIYLMMVILFRSFAAGLLALIPNLLPIVCYFGFLGWTGIRLDITTSLVATAALGLAVDNAVHAIRRYRQSVSADREGSTTENEGWAVWLTLLRTGKPMVLANLMLMAAFLLFMLSSFVPVRTAGLLWAVTILACLAADLLFLPALMKSWPFLRIALGAPRQTSTEIIEQTFSATAKQASHR